MVLQLDQAKAAADDQGPVDLPEADGFPTEVFPEVLQDFVRTGTKAIGCPEDFLAVPMLVIASGAIGSTRVLKVKEKCEFPPWLYGMFIGQPGDAKTPALNLVAEPLHQRQQELIKDYQEKLHRFKEELDPVPNKPQLVRVYAADSTREALASLLDTNPRGLTLIRDELSGWVKSQNEYKRGGQGSDRQFWLENWTGYRSLVDRKQDLGQGGRHPRSCASVIGGIQPDMLFAFTDNKGTKDGFLDRLLPSFPAPLAVPEWTEDVVSAASAQAWRDAINTLLCLTHQDNDSQGRPRRMVLTEQARAKWKELMDCLAEEMNALPRGHFLRGVWSKLRVYAGRLALVVHCLIHVPDDAVTF